MRIKPDLVLDNPTVNVLGIFDSLHENGTLDFKYLEVYFQEEGKSTTYSRYWTVDSDDIAAEIVKIDVLNTLLNPTSQAKKVITLEAVPSIVEEKTITGVAKKTFKDRLLAILVVIERKVDQTLKYMNLN